MEKISKIILVIGILCLCISALGFIMYSIVLSLKVKRLEKKLPKKGEKCFCYVYRREQGDNGSIIYYVVAHLESQNINKIFHYQSFTNFKLKCNQVTIGCYYKNNIVLDDTNIDIKDLPQNIIDAFELNNEDPV